MQSVQSIYNQLTLANTEDPYVEKRELGRFSISKSYIAIDNAFHNGSHMRLKP